MKEASGYLRRDLRVFAGKGLCLLVEMGMNTAGETPNRSASWAIWEDVWGRIPFLVSK